MKTEIDEQRLVVEENKSAQDALTRQLESKKMKQDHLNEIKKAEQELEKRNMGDQNMLRHKAIQMAKQSYAGKYVEKVTMTNMNKDDPSGAVLAGLLAKYDLCKKAAGVE